MTFLSYYLSTARKAFSKFMRETKPAEISLLCQSGTFCSFSFSSKIFAAQSDNDSPYLRNEYGGSKSRRFYENCGYSHTQQLLKLRMIFVYQCAGTLT